jgi:membrane-associated phospholipid phosphatase
MAGLLGGDTPPGNIHRSFLWAGGTLLAAATGVFRVLSGNHFPTDVLAGAAVGSLTAVAVHCASR